MTSSARRLPPRGGVVEECYGLEHQGDSSVFRYVGLLEIEDGCLPCHGDPAGEKDITGYAKEGMAEGDVAGAVSIVMPMDSIIADAKADLVSTVVFFCVLMGSVTLVLALGLLYRRLPLPLLTRTRSCAMKPRISRTSLPLLPMS